MDLNKAIDDLQAFHDKEFVKEGIMLFEDDPKERRRILGNALWFLKAQKPRVLTVEELREKIGEPVFFENQYSGEWRIITGATKEKMFTVSGMESTHQNYFEFNGIVWRCWNMKPTDEQRLKEPWNKEG